MSIVTHFQDKVYLVYTKVVHPCYRMKEFNIKLFFLTIHLSIRILRMRLPRKDIYLIQLNSCRVPLNHFCIQPFPG